jgi:hypothetical protein
MRFRKSNYGISTVSGYNPKGLFQALREEKIFDPYKSAY